MQFFSLPASEFRQVVADPSAMEEDCAGVHPLPCSGDNEEKEPGIACCDATQAEELCSHSPGILGLSLWVVWF